MTTPQETCANCAFAHKPQSGSPECRRYPKSVTIVVVPRQTLRGAEMVPQALSVFSGWNDGDWCGEFTHKRSVLLS